MFINHSNHPSVQWDETQRMEAARYGPIVDVPFPAIDPESTAEAVEALVRQHGADIVDRKPSIVMVQGEFTYTYKMVEFLKAHNVKVVAATSERIVKTLDDSNTKQVTFHFVQFREF